jgi:DNA-directed RNA polymerase specialized sigma24 family protein
MLPTGTLVGTGHSRRGSPGDAIDEAADRLTSEIRRHKAMLRREFLFHRRRRRRGDLSGIALALEECRDRGDWKTFTDLLRPALRELSDHARRELIIAQFEGVAKPGDVTVSGLLSELVHRAWGAIDRRPKHLPLELWLTGLLHDILDERGEEPVRRSVETVVPGDARLSADSGGHADMDAAWPLLETLTLADVVAVPESGSAWERASDEEQRVWIVSQLSGFPRVQRRAFTLHALEGWNDEEIAALQRRTPEEVLLDVDRVRDELTRKLEQPSDPITAHSA